MASNLRLGLVFFLALASSFASQTCLDGSQRLTARQTHEGLVLLQMRPAELSQRSWQPDDGPAPVLAAVEEGGQVAAACHTALVGERCHAGVEWARRTGIFQRPEWYPGLSRSSSFEEFQAVLHAGGHSHCPMPCEAAMPNAPTPAPAAPTPAPAVPASPTLPGWHPTSGREGAGKWCGVGVPESSWVLKSCDVAGPVQRVKVLSYNLFWWNLFDRRGGNHGSAGKLIRRGGEHEAYDLMAFQEADDVNRVMRDAGMVGQYTVVSGGGMGWVFRTSRWAKLGDGWASVAEDRPEQWYGRRSVQWGRVQHRSSGKTVFFANHHGPLPVNTGGICGGRGTAYNILKVIAENARSGDAIIVAGDFNAAARSSEIRELDKRLVRVFSGTAIGGIDHFYSNCNMTKVITARKLGRGGSDHDAIEATFEL